MLALIFGTIVNVATETLVFGFCLQACAQFEILTHRLHKMTRLSGQEEARKSPSKDTSSRASRLSRHIFIITCV